MEPDLTQKQKALKITCLVEHMLEKQVFYDWFNHGRFLDYLSGGDIKVTKDEILLDIAKMMNLSNEVL